jgi:hypothetical protein
MTTQTTPAKPEPTEALVYIDHAHAVIVEHEPDGREVIEVLNRKRAETETAFEGRAADEVADQDRVVVSGPAFARTDFERAYVALTHRPDRIVDVEPTADRGRTHRAFADL